MSFLRNPVISRPKRETVEPENKPQIEVSAKESVEFRIVCEYWFKIESTSKRLEKLRYFTQLLILLSYYAEDDMADVLLLLSNNIRDPWEELPSCLNCGEQLVKKAILDAFSVNSDEMKSSIKQTGDIALSCEKFKKRQPKEFIQSRPLTVHFLIEEFRRIADVQGNKANEERSIVIRKLLLAGTALESRYIVRLLVGKRRLGFERKTMLSALADYLCSRRLKCSVDVSGDVELQLDRIWNKVAEHEVSNRTIDELDDDNDDNDDNDAPNAADDHEYESMAREAILEIAKHTGDFELSGNVRQQSYYVVLKAFAKLPSLTRLAHQIDNLENVNLTPFVPILPMLAKPVSSYAELFELDAQFYTEYKYDGFRAQVHCCDGCLQIYSRSQENMSERFPDVLQSIKSVNAAANSFIIDGEIVPVSANGDILPFEMLSRRLKVYEAAENASSVKFFCFDIMMLDSVGLLSMPFVARRRLLELVFAGNQLFQLATQRYCKTQAEIEEFLSDAVAHKTEGLIVKTRSSKYAPDRRSRHWTKLKKDYLDSVGDSFDLVPVAGWYGKGKRTGVVGSYLLACRNGELYQTVTCTGTGMSDEFLAAQQWEQRDTCPKCVQTTESYSGSSAPDFWIDPAQSKVWEIKVANLSLSRMHTCYTRNNQGIAARLPRLIREREDKDPTQCTTAEFIYERFQAQPDRQGEEQSEFEQEAGESEQDSESV